MSALNPVTFLEKLAKLNATQQSIETLSQWCIFFRKDAGQIVELWDREFSRSQDVNRMLALIYLANDILQNSRKKGPQFVNEFFTRLPPAVEKLVKTGGTEVQEKLLRMMRVWDERKVFGSSGVKVFADILGVPAQSAIPSTAGRKRGNIVLQSNDPTVNSLSDSMQEADEAHSRSVRLESQTSTVLRAEESQGGAQQLKAAIKSLQLQTVALENEIGHRSRVIGILEDLLSQQRQLKDTAEEEWRRYRMSLESKQKQSTSNSGAETGIQQDPLVQQKASAVQPPPSQSSQEAVVSPTSSADPRDPRRRPADAQPAAPAHTASDSLAQLMGVAQNGSAASESSAADLVARLSQEGASAQLLLDALASLPNGGTLDGVQDQQSNLALALDNDDEYDPELGV